MCLGALCHCDCWLQIVLPVETLLLWSVSPSEQALAQSSEFDTNCWAFRTIDSSRLYQLRTTSCRHNHRSHHKSGSKSSCDSRVLNNPPPQLDCCFFFFIIKFSYTDASHYILPDRAVLTQPTMMNKLKKLDRCHILVSGSKASWTKQRTSGLLSER